MKTTFKLIYLTRSALESRTHFFNSLIKIKDFAPAILFFEPLIENDPFQMLFLAKKISAYLSDNGLINTIITLEKFRNIPSQIPFIIGVPVRNHSLQSYEELYNQIKKELPVQEIIVFSEDEKQMQKTSRDFLANYSYQIVRPVHKV